MTRTLLRLSVFVILATLVFVTLSPIGLRPMVAPANVERMCAYALFGFLLILAYPRRWYLGLMAGMAVAGILEFGQEFSPTRHARTADFVVKAAAAAFGSLAAYLVLAAYARFERPSATR
ncbi:hypothetical protein [Methylobacterium marchantiae]|uniref:VanZ family protein n=1 Tax=Methylobacterium marchantiae TaxID=600331 RepID=A0ABW3WS04_9HYPH|nr:hypothetical protein AIGOOFII_2553 [Methylobacterium marchantiae]